MSIAVATTMLAVLTTAASPSIPRPKLPSPTGVIKATACDLSKAPKFEDVPTQANLSKFRQAILRHARGELGRVHPSQDGITIPPATVTKKGADRLLAYSMVAYGSGSSDPNQWLMGLPAMIGKHQKHTTWCGIFALWATKSGAAVSANDYASALTTAFGNPIVAMLAMTFYEFYAPAWADGSKWAAYKKVEWRNGKGITVPIAGGQRKSKLPTPVATWFAKKQAPPIRPGDIGYARIKLVNPPPGSDGYSYHHFLVEKVHEMNGHLVYYTIEGNFDNQQIKRHRRCYAAGYNGIDAFYDVDALPNP